MGGTLLGAVSGPLGRRTERPGTWLSVQPRCRPVTPQTVSSRLLEYHSIVSEAGPSSPPTLHCVQ